MDTKETPNPGDPLTLTRKGDHIRINLEEDVRARGIEAGFDRYRFVPRALPEIDLDQVDTTLTVFGRKLQSPLLISCMTGGTAEAQQINLTLAGVAQRFGLALGLGSARVLLEQPDVLPTFAVRSAAPDVLLLANLGAVQLNRGVTSDQCRRLVEMIDADALALHLNPLQEALQPEGDTCFAGLLARIADLCDQLPVPVVVKEVGWGIAPDVVGELLAVGVAAVDVAGAGGTSWSEVERHRLADPVQRAVAAAFAGWGIPTAQAIRDARRSYPDTLLFASGGVRDGIDAAKALALGADLVGLAGPFLRAAAEGAPVAERLAAELNGVLRTVMFGVGAPSLSSFRTRSRLVALAGDGSPTTVSSPLMPEGQS